MDVFLKDKDWLLEGDKSLSHLYRFKPEKLMFYRDTVEIHQERVAQILLYLIYPSSLIDESGYESERIISPLEATFEFFHSDLNSSGKLDICYLLKLARLHDWIEGFTKTKDKATHLKNRETPVEKIEREIDERAAIMRICESVQLSSNNYLRFMLHDANIKSTLEAKLLSYIDKVDGFLSCFHEVTAGNQSFKNPFMRYISEIQKFIDGKFSELKPLFESNSPFCNPERLLAQEYRVDELIKLGSAHKVSDLNKSFGLVEYKMWKLAYRRILPRILSLHDERDINYWMFTQREF